MEAEGVEEEEKQEWLRRGTGMVLLSTSGSSLFHSTAFYPKAPLLGEEESHMFVRKCVEKVSPDT